jgi:hypothetical protein
MAWEHQAVRHPLRCPAMGAISGHIQDPAAGIVLSRETGDVLILLSQKKRLIQKVAGEVLSESVTG